MLKKCEAFAVKHIFSVRILYIESIKTVKEMTLNELVKLTIGPSIINSYDSVKQTEAVQYYCQVGITVYTSALESHKKTETNENGSSV